MTCIPLAGNTHIAPSFFIHQTVFRTPHVNACTLHWIFIWQNHAENKIITHGLTYTDPWPILKWPILRRSMTHWPALYRPIPRVCRTYCRNEFYKKCRVTGDWVVSILYEGRNIEGSPFNVRVHDPGQIRVIGLDASLASRNYTFSGKFYFCLLFCQ